MLTRSWPKYMRHWTHSSVLRGLHLRVSNTARPLHTELTTSNHCFHTVPLEQLQVLFTFFSKFFSPFVHTTSSLSVSQEYLALDEIYHLFRAAIPNNPTREKLDTYWMIDGNAYGILTLSDALFQRTYSRINHSVTNDPKTTIRRTIRLPDFKFELCPLHSPLLRASLLVSFPPVNNMLKSTGWSCLIRGRGFNVNVTHSLQMFHKGSLLRNLIIAWTWRLLIIASNIRSLTYDSRSSYHPLIIWYLTPISLKGSNTFWTLMITSKEERVYCRHSSRHAWTQHPSAICVQEFDDSRNSAIHMTYRSSLRSSSTWEPRYPLLQVVLVIFCFYVCVYKHQLDLHSFTM